ncbi:MAG: hypothetical protein A4E54_01050 [Pelotomaculum sp. PtaB.Bin117]|nr:MAG: hypothetical protein A4E54_01050 [Pelotomaculum sp. PtaB.Bin117]OPY63870.1 MAG: hypothetical protein A4E56_00220 [Pelotomaculum sp. PtaU1.Bin065]
MTIPQTDTEKKEVTDFVASFLCLEQNRLRDLKSHSLLNHLDIYFPNRLYSTCAISALVVVLSGVSFPALPPTVPVLTSSVMASFAHESICPASVNWSSVFPLSPSGSWPLTLSALYSRVNIS